MYYDFNALRPLLLRASTAGLAATLAVVLWPLHLAAEPHCWPGFLGAGATTLAPDSIPVRWSSTENVAWQLAIRGKGQSSPVIWGDTVFVTSIEGAMKDRCLVSAISLDDGRPRWCFQQAASQPVRANYYQSRSAPTPAVDDRRVYAFFETGNLVALTHAGEQVWSRSLTEDYGEFEVRIGLAGSPAQDENCIYILIDHEGPSYLLAVDKASGKTKWKTERFSRSSYASPTILCIAGRPQLVCSSGGSIDGYDPNDGRQLWTYEDVGGNRATLPMPAGGDRFLVSASPGMHDRRLADARKSNGLMRVQLTDGEYHPKWEWKTNQAMPGFGSPIVHRGLAYWVTKAGVLYCFDLSDGQLVYRHRAGQPCWATPLALDNRIYLFGKDGVTTVVAAGPKFELLAENLLFSTDAAMPQRSTKAEPVGLGEVARDVGAGGVANLPASGSAEHRQASREGLVFADPVQYGYAVVDGSLVIRSGKQLYCIRHEVSQAESKPVERHARRP